MEPADFKTWWQTLSDTERAAAAEIAGTTVSYVSAHLIYRRKRPQVNLMKGLAKASAGVLTYEQILAFFYGDPEHLAGESAA
jgi:hypothetical protein